MRLLIGFILGVLAGVALSAYFTGRMVTVTIAPQELSTVSFPTAGGTFSDQSHAGGSNPSLPGGSNPSTGNNISNSNTGGVTNAPAGNVSDPPPGTVSDP